jgi:hypothetical protein
MDGLDGLLKVYKKNSGYLGAANGICQKETPAGGL